MNPIGSIKLVAWALASVALWGTFGCRAPTPKPEPPRIPSLMTDAQYGTVGEPLIFALASFVPDPQFKPDSLDPNRYAAGDLTFSCLTSCPDGLTVSATSGAVSWTPQYLQSGAYFVVFGVRSGIFSSVKTIPLVVRDVDRAPVWQGPALVPAKEASPFSYTATAVDPDGDQLEYLCTSGCPAGLTVDSKKGIVTWTPTYDDAGDHVVTITAKSRPAVRPTVLTGVDPTIVATDLAQLRAAVEAETIDRTKWLSAGTQLTIRVAPTPRPPVVGAVPDMTVAEADLLSLKIPASDPDGKQLSFACTSPCPNGLQVDTSTGAVSWRPTYGQHGTYQVSILVTASDYQAPTTAKLNILVTKTYRPPVLGPQVPPVAGAESFTLGFNLAATDPDPEATLTFSCAASCPTGLLVDPVSGAVTWTPDYGQAGSYAPSFSVSDGQTTLTEVVQITVVPTNRAPYFVSPPAVLQIAAAQAFSYRLIATDPDVPDVGKLQFSCVAGCPAGLGISQASGQLNWTPSYAQSGTYQVTLQVSDPHGLTDTTTVAITVTKIFLAPVFSGPLVASGVALSPLTFTLLATAPNGTPVVYGCSAGCPDGLTVDQSTGAVSWTPTAQQFGVFAPTFSARSTALFDPTLTKTTNLVGKLTIAKLKRPPTVGLVADQTVNEGGHQTTSFQSRTGFSLDFTVQASDPNGQPLSYLCTDNCPLGLLVNQVTGEVTWTPAYNQAQAADAPYTGIRLGVTNGDFLVKTNAFSITVHDVHRPPVITQLSDQAVYEGGHCSSDEQSPTGCPLSFTVQALSPDNYPISFSCVGQTCPQGLTIDPQTGQVSWTPAYGQNTTRPLDTQYAGVTFSVSDSLSTTISGPITILVKFVPLSPVVSQLASPAPVYENGHLPDPARNNIVDEQSPTSTLPPVSFNLASLAVSPDVPPAPLTFSCVLGCPAGLQVNPQSGDVTWRPGHCSARDPVGSSGCMPDTTTLFSENSQPGNPNPGALPKNAPYQGILFAASDPYGKQTFFNPILVQVINVPRAPRWNLPTGFVAASGTAASPAQCAAMANLPAQDGTTTSPAQDSTVAVAEGCWAKENLSAYSPDGDQLTYGAASITTSDNNQMTTMAPSASVFPPTGDQRLLVGHTQWLRWRSIGSVTMGTPSLPVGSYDALRANAPYAVTWKATATSVNFAPLTISSTSTQPVKILHVVTPVVVPTVGSLQMPEAAQTTFQMGLPGDLPHNTYGEFSDDIEYYCAAGCPSGLAELPTCGHKDLGQAACSPMLTVHQSATLSCDYAANPNGCQASPGPYGAQLGRVLVQTGYNSAQLQNQPYQMTMRAVITLDGWSGILDGIDYSPTTNDQTVTLGVQNVDRPPQFCSDPGWVGGPCQATQGDGPASPGDLVTDYGVNPPAVDLHEPCSPPYWPGAIHDPCFPGSATKTFSLVSIDLDSEYAATEDAPTVALLGCTDYQTSVDYGGVASHCPAADPEDPGNPYSYNPNSGTCLKSCPAGLFGLAPGQTPGSLVVQMTAGPNTAAPCGKNPPTMGGVANQCLDGGSGGTMSEKSRFAVFYTAGCPLGSTGWACAVEPDPTNEQNQAATIAVQWTIHRESLAPATPIFTAASTTNQESPTGIGSSALSLQGGSMDETDTLSAVLSVSAPPVNFDGSSDPVVMCVRPATTNQYQFSRYLGGCDNPTVDQNDGLGISSDAGLLMSNSCPVGPSGFGCLATNHQVITSWSQSQQISTALTMLPKLAGGTADRNCVNRANSLLDKSFVVTACSAPTLFTGKQPSCYSPAPGQHCSLAASASIAVRDLDRPPNIVSLTYPQSSPESQNGSISVTIRVTDPDAYDQSHLTASEVNPNGTLATYPGGMGQLEPHPTLPGVPKSVTLTSGGSPQAAPNGIWTDVTFSYLNNFDMTNEYGVPSGYASRANPTVSFSPTYQVCYSGTSQCFDNQQATFSVTNTKRMPYFKTLNVGFTPWSCTLLPDPVVGDVPGPGFPATTVTGILFPWQWFYHCSQSGKTSWDEYDFSTDSEIGYSLSGRIIDQQSGYPKAPASSLYGPSGTNRPEPSWYTPPSSAAQTYPSSGVLTWTLWDDDQEDMQQEPNTGFASNLTVTECPGSDSLMGALQAGVPGLCTGSTAASCAQPGLPHTDSLGTGGFYNPLNSGFTVVKNLQSRIFSPCLMTCLVDEAQSCTRLAQNSTSISTSYNNDQAQQKPQNITLSVAVKNSPRPPKVPLDVSISGYYACTANGPGSTCSVPVESCDDPTVAEDILRGMPEQYSDKDGDLASGFIVKLESAGPQAVHKTCDGFLCNSTHVDSCAGGFWYRIAPSNNQANWSNLGWLRISAGQHDPGGFVNISSPYYVWPPTSPF